MRFLSVLALLCGPLLSAEEIPLPLKPDPPFAVDGDLSDWRTVPGTLSLADPAQVVYGKTSWTGPQDCSGTLRLAWRYETLYLTAEVRDDFFRQSQRGRELWRGDCVMLFIDPNPSDPSSGLYQFGFSPGSFGNTGDALRDVKPEAFCYRPEGTEMDGVLVAAVRSAEGYVLEAAIPWTVFGAPQAAPNDRIAVEVAISDTDGEDPQQESMLTLGTTEWDISRARLLPSVLAQADGSFEELAPATRVFDAVTLPRAGKESFTFTLDTLPQGREAVLRLLARLDYAQVAGYSPSLALTLNGVSIDAPRLLNKPLRAKARSGDIYSMAGGDRFSAYYAPDFTSPDTHPHYGLVDDIRPCEFELRVTDAVRSGENVLEVAHRGEINEPLVVADAEIRFVTKLPAVREKTGAPTGPLAKIVPTPVRDLSLTLEQAEDGTFAAAVDGKTLRVESRYSTPDGAWVQGSNAHFTLTRRLEKLPEGVRVQDTFVNLTQAPLPLMHRHEVALEGAPERVWLAGLEQPNKSGNVISPSNPTLCVTTGGAGFGMLPLDDVFRVHGAAYVVGQTAGLADSQLVLAPGATYTSEWAILPVPQGDYWTFLNAARRLVDANFLIDGGFAFLRNGPLTEAWSDQQLRDFMVYKDAKYFCASNADPLYNGMYTHGTAFQRVSHDSYREAFARWRALVPGRTCMVYFHCFLDVVEDGPELFKDARLLTPDGKQGDYGEPFYRLYLPLENNSYGPAIAKNVDAILDEIGADGVYWDEHEYSRMLYHYGEPWDGYSGDIDAQTMQVRGLKSSVTLLTEAWRLALAKHILAQGPLIGNGPPFTRAMSALKFPCFVETGSITHCAQSHLHSPIALGDHLTETSELDAYKTMLAALDFGCVYDWYNDVTVQPTHPHLTSYMFPITPMELHEGYIIGQERIITKKSGLYGWGDMSGHEVHVFDDTGRETAAYAAPEMIEEGARYTELRLAEDWSAAIVRKKTAEP